MLQLSSDSSRVPLGSSPFTPQQLLKKHNFPYLFNEYFAGKKERNLSEFNEITVYFQVTIYAEQNYNPELMVQG